MLGIVTEYLERKRLCLVEKGVPRTRSASSSRRFRYPDLAIRKDGDESVLVNLSGTDQIKIWWQDHCLAAPGVTSRVGAITASAKSGSKTGLSHIMDWAQLGGLITKTGELLGVGRLIARLRQAQSIGEINPYILGNERLAFGHQLLLADFDIFSRLIRKIAVAEKPIRKAAATKLFAEAVTEISQEARESRNLSTKGKYAIFDIFKDLESAGRRSGKAIDETSTAWHRASSRLETYVDLGLLDKGAGGEGERFEYIYYPTARLDRALSSLHEESTARDWIERRLASVIYDDVPVNAVIEERVFANVLMPLITCLSRPSAPLPLDTLSIGLAWLLNENGHGASIAACRSSLEALAVERPNIARLSRGGFGDRAEFVSLDVRKLEELQL
jgi:hypothetical protein